MKRNLIVAVAGIALLAVLLIVLILGLSTPDIPQPTSTSDSVAPSSSIVPPQSTGTSLPESTPPVTIPQPTAPTASVLTISANEKVGTIYTRAELDAIDNTRQTYWPSTEDGKRPMRITTMQRENRAHNVYFIAADSAVAYLTFNCDKDQFATNSAGEPKSYTSVVLDILKNYSVKATFFVTGRFCHAYPDIVQRIIDEGHILGNYGYSSIELPGLTTEEMTAQIMSLHDYIQETFGYTMTQLRPYGDAYSLRTFALANSLGYTTVLYSASYLDKSPDAQLNDSEAFDKIISQIHHGAIFRMHTISPNTLAILTDVIGVIRDSYYRIALFNP